MKNFRFIILAVFLSLIFLCPMAVLASGDKETQGTPAAGQAMSSDQPLNGKKIGISPYWLDSGNTIYTNGMKSYFEPKGASVTILNPNGDAATQRAEVNEFITAKYDAVILCPVNAAQEVDYLRKLQDAGIRTLLFWNVVPQDQMQGLKAPVYQLNDYEAFKQAGMKAVHYVKDVMHETPRAVIWDDASNPVLHARANGFEDGLKAADPNVTILFRDNVDFTVNGSRAKMQNLLTAYPNMNIISPSNGAAAAGIWAALTAAGRGKANDKVAKTEYLLECDPNDANMRRFLDPSTSVIDMVNIQMWEGGIEVAKQTEAMLSDPNWKDVSLVSAVPSMLMSHDCAMAAEQYSAQNSTLKDYRPISCDDAAEPWPEDW